MNKNLLESKLITDEQWKEYQNLKKNWNQLKDFIKECYIETCNAEAHFILDGILDKMESKDKHDK